MAINPTTELPDQIGPLGRIRPEEIGDEELRVEDIMAWLEGMDPLKPVRIVMKTRDSRVVSDIHTITEEDGTVDIFPTKMPTGQKDLRALLAEKATAMAEKATAEILVGRSDEERSIDDSADTILDAIRKRKQASRDKQDPTISSSDISEYLDVMDRAKAEEEELNKLCQIRRQRERLTGAE